MNHVTIATSFGIVWLMLVCHFAIVPLLLLLYWVGRVGLRGRVSGLIVAEPRSIP